MSNLLAGILFPVIIGISLLLSLYSKKKKVIRQSPSVEFKMSVPRNFPEVIRQNAPSSFYRANGRPSLQIRLPKLVD